MNQSEVSIPLLRMALAYKYLLHKSTKRSIRWANRNYKAYRKFILYRQQLGILEPGILKPKLAIKELLSQGFIPISQFKVRNKSGLYAYIVTNEVINKHLPETYIYPEHFIHGYSPKKGYKEIYQALCNNPGVGVPGYTRIYLTKYKNGYAR